MNWIATILNLVPIFATGFHILHQDKTLGERTQLAQDSLGLAVAGATATLPPDKAEIAVSVGQIAQSTLAQTLAALHHATPAPAPIDGAQLATQS